ncbi:hypothetical protein BJ508DRAFT_328670 [Ascobolus immersus RN42]|uniref:Uncharacterized protein n=1 Tax=Ascobolus immersus RN42 TaxID=1160509 RepID=A0A3N4HZ08_ASCIM|nr:hypothetical protein BJ508DRAFT_328670 [Ascobolus immersus RN42]
MGKPEIVMEYNHKGAPPPAYHEANGPASVRKPETAHTKPATFEDEKKHFDTEAQWNHEEKKSQPTAIGGRVRNANKDSCGRSFRRCVCLLVIVLLVFAVLFLAFIPLIVSRRHKTTSSIYSSLVQCKSSTPYSEAAQHSSRKGPMFSIPDKSSLFTPYTGQCDYNLPSTFSTPHKNLGRASLINTPFQISYPGYNADSSLPSQEVVRRINKLERNKHIPINLVLVPEVVSKLFDHDPHRRISSKMACLTKPLPKKNPKVREAEWLSLLDDGFLDDLGTMIEISRHKSAWKKIKNRIEDYKKEAIQFMPADGYVWDQDKEKVAEKGSGEAQMWYCWLRDAE